MTPLGFALLGLIARRPQSGYDLAAHLKKPIASFWTARLSQIYPELASLEQHGLVSVEVVPQEGRPAKKVYALTREGRRVLAEWVATPPEPAAPRDELLLKTYAIAFADPEATAKMLRERAAAAEAEGAHFEEVLARIEDAHDGPPPPSEPAFGQYANLRYGAAATRERAKWLRWLEAELTKPRPNAKKNRK